MINNDEEIIIFDQLLNTSDRNRHYLEKIGVFDLDKLTDAFCYLHFRFYKADIRRLVAAFNIPSKIIIKTGVTMSGEEAMCLLLMRLAYPIRFLARFSLEQFTRFHLLITQIHCPHALFSQRAKCPMRGIQLHDRIHH